MFMCEECNYIWEEKQRYIGDPETTHCPECGSAEIEETRPQILPKANAYSLLADVLAEFQKHGHASPEKFEMRWDTLEKILSKYFS